jgi:hypothetical protein
MRIFNACCRPPLPISWALEHGRSSAGGALSFGRAIVRSESGRREREVIARMGNCWGGLVIGLVLGLVITCCRSRQRA